MGADENSILKKCGEILINIKLRTKKTKTYTFNCVFCNTNWDQLKKFSAHLEDQHSANFSEEVEHTIFEPEIKLEEHAEVKKSDAILKNLLKEPSTAELYEDPLEPIEFVAATENNTNLLDVKVKHESEESYQEDLNEYENESHVNDDMDYEDCTENKDDVKPLKKDTKTSKNKRSKKKIKDLSEESTDDANDSDFDINDELTSYKRKVFVKKESPLKSKKHKKVKKEPEQEPEIYSESERELIKTLFESFAKHPYLWDDNKRKRISPTMTCEKGFEIVANEVNEKLNTNITGEEAKKRLNTMRIKYSYELEKQRKDEDHKIPWYSEHMEFLQKNIDNIIRSRTKKRHNKRATKMDETSLLQFIELYKKYDSLWQVNNIAFGVIAKREETLKSMIEDLKTNHNKDMTIENLHDYIKYINRLYSKDKEQQLKCELENKEFSPLSPLYKELSFLSESQGPFKCTTCNEILPKYESYHIHNASHTNTMPFKCPLCELGFKKFDKYIIHAKRHLGINSFQCSVCGKGYPFKSELDWHFTSHSGEKPYLCQVCGAGFRARHDYDNHIRRHEKRYRYECHICKHGFNQLHHYNDHVKSHLNIRDIICNICGKAFTAVKYLKNHKLIHDDTKRYKCNVCGKEFSQTAGLRQHRKQHKPHLTAAERKRKNESIPSFPDVFQF